LPGAWLVLLVSLSACCLESIPYKKESPGRSSPTLVNRPALRTIEGLPLAFEPNQGQAPAPVRFLSRGRGLALLLSSDQARITWPSTDETREPAKNHGLEIHLIGANRNSLGEGEEGTGAKANYFL